MRLSDLFENAELDEMPMANLQKVGNWEKSSSFKHANDRKLLNNPKALAKITAAWEKTPVDFNCFLINHADGVGKSEVGEVDRNWLARNFPRVGEAIQIRDDAINVIFTNNNGSEHMPMTAWIMAHRVGHVFDRYTVKDPTYREMRAYLFDTIQTLLEQGYELKVSKTTGNFAATTADNRRLANFFAMIGTFRSARQGLIDREGEFLHELFAQYMLTGSIKFNPLQKRATIKSSTFVWKGTDADLDYYNSGLEDIAETLSQYFETMLHNNLGRIYVM